jgi:hypothetical protein
MKIWTLTGISDTKNIFRSDNGIMVIYFLKLFKIYKPKHLRMKWQGI